jgi:hypothetical protein
MGIHCRNSGFPTFSGSSAYEIPVQVQILIDHPTCFPYSFYIFFIKFEGDDFGDLGRSDPGGVALNST